jgi:foldase protein PrsA
MKDQMEKELKSSKLTNEKINEVMQTEIEDAKVKISDKDLESALDPATSAAQ